MASTDSTRPPARAHLGDPPALDFEHLDGLMLVGIAVLIIALSVGLALFRGKLAWAAPRGRDEGPCGASIGIAAASALGTEPNE